MGESGLVTAPDPLTAQAALVPDTLAVLDPEGERLPFAELEARANRLAHGLAGLGLAGGDPVIWCGPNSIEVLVTLHAARKAGLLARIRADAYLSEPTERPASGGPRMKGPRHGPR